MTYEKGVSTVPMAEFLSPESVGRIMTTVEPANAVA
jgi:hypothetical protein